MANEFEIGKKLFKDVIREHKKSNAILDSFDKELARLNKKTTKQATAIYRDSASKLDIDSYNNVVSSMENLALLTPLLEKLELLQNDYRRVISGLFRSYRIDYLGAVGNRTRVVAKRLKSIGIEIAEPRVTDETYTVLEAINTQTYKKLNQMLVKWKEFVYDKFFEGVTKSYSLPIFIGLFYTADGTLKIGSSLDGESELIASQQMIAQKTEYNMREAKKEGLTYCWNANPMDRLTKPECINACLAGVIPEGQMGTDHGFPPRFICRCEIVYTRPEWTGVNAGVNSAIEGARKRLIEELQDAPRQKSRWIRSGTLVIPKDPLRAAGTKMYADIEGKLKVATSGEVPEWETPDGVIPI